VWRGESDGEAAERRRRLGVTSSEEPRSSQTRRAPSTHVEVETGAARRGFDVPRRTDGRLSSFLQARAYAKQPTTRMPAGGRWCGSRAEAAHQRCNQARQSCRKLRGCALRVSVAHMREQENPEVRGGVSITGHREKYPRLSSTHYNPWQASLSPTEPRHRRAFLIADSVLLHNQGYPKVCPDSLNLPNAGDSFAGIPGT
jgi:hypothetical protein